MKLLVCDDDISTIDVIQSQLNCQDLGITRILRAYNGEAAKEVILAEQPELILCDIGMPKVDGVEVLKFIYENNIYAEFAFLTCYDDFEHARFAVRYGARNYLTKPVDFDELNEALHRMAQAVKKHRQLLQRTDDYTVSDAYFNHVLRQIQDCGSDLSQNRIAHILQQNNITTVEADTPIRPVVIFGDITKAFDDGWNRELLSYSFSRLVEESLTDYVGLRFTTVSITDRYVSTATFVKARDFSENDCLVRARQLVSLCARTLSISPVCIIGGEVPFYMTPEAILALQGQMRKVLLQGGSVFLQRDVEKISGADHSVIEEEQVLRAIRAKDKTMFMGLVSGAVDKIVYSRKDASSMMAILHKELIQAVYNDLNDNHIQLKTLFESKQMQSLDWFAERSASDMMSFASCLFDFTVLELERSASGTDIIGSVKQYIHSHFKEDLDRNALAVVVHITPNYLSKRFRAETGMSLREYINQLRVDEAKRLLISTNSTISEVASAVGYDNISYFSTVFKKLCGMPPIEWCNGKRNEGNK